MSVVQASEVKWTPDQMVEVTLGEPDDFLNCLLYTSPSPRDCQ